MASIRRFLLISLLLSMAIVTLSGGMWTYSAIGDEVDEILDAELIEAARVLKILFVNNLAETNLNRLQATMTALPEEQISLDSSGLTHTPRYALRRVFQIWNQSGRLLLRSKNAPRYPLSQGESGFDQTNIGHTQWQVYTLNDSQRGLRFQVAQLSLVRENLAQTIGTEHVYHFAIICPILGILIWLIVSYGLRHLYRITDDVDHRHLNNLEPMDSKQAPNEIRPLVVAINQLLHRLKNAFSREKRFTADAAHELRTPLAALKTQLQVAARLDNKEQREKALANVTKAVDRCTHVVSQLLTLSRLQPDQPLNEVENLDINSVLKIVIADLTPMAVAKDITISLDWEQDKLDIMGNDTSLMIMYRNLIDNAIRYTSEGGEVRIKTLTQAGKVIVQIIDSGPGIPTELRSRVFDRFYRRLGTKASGSGLGLSIVQQIIQLHHGEIELKTPENKQGLCVETRFSLA